MPPRWFFLALALATAVMHAGVFGVCAEETTTATAPMTMAATSADHGSDPHGSEGPDQPGHLDSQACQATLPPVSAGTAVALVTLAVITVALTSPALRHRLRFSPLDWRPPPSPRSSLCVWRI
jgi:hypothetical protein